MKKTNNLLWNLITEDRKVVELLDEVEGANEGYPSDMLAARRQAFLNNMAGAGLNMGTGSVLESACEGWRQFWSHSYCSRQGIGSCLNCCHCS